MKQGKKLLTGATLMLALSAGQATAASPLISFSPANAVVADNTKLVSNRPAVADRLFVSDAVEKKIKEVKKLLKDNAYLAWMFENCYPNTIDTTAHLMAKTTLLYILVTSMLCGFAIVVHRYGLTCSIATKMPN